MLFILFFDKINTMTIPFEPIIFNNDLNIHLSIEYFAFFQAFRHYVFDYLFSVIIAVCIYPTAQIFFSILFLMILQ